MLKPKAMCKVSIVGSISVLKESITVLHDMALLHIDEFRGSAVPSGDYSLQIGAPLPESDAISSSLVKVRSVMSHLPKLSEEHLRTAHPSGAGELAKIDQQVKEYTDALKALDDEKSRIGARFAELKPFAASGLDLESFGDYSSIAVFAGYIPGRKKAALDQIKNKAAAKFPKSELFLWGYDGKTVIAFFVELKKKDEAREFLAKHGYSEINLLPLKGLKGHAPHIIKSLEAERAKLEEKRKHLEADLAQISKNWLLFFKKKESELVAESEKAQAPLKFATTKNAFVAEGWIPKEKCPEVRHRLEQATKNRVYLEESGDLHDAPIMLENPKPIEPFEFFMNLYALPKYLEIDPTFFMFLTFPIFFGMMLGDVGYGLVSLFIFAALKSRFRSGEIKSLLNVMTLSAISSILFGFVFGEFFGEEKVAGFALPHLINRLNSVNEMLIITAAMGVIHINIGFILGFINKLKEHGFIHALLEKGAWLILEAGIVLFAASHFNYISASKYIGIALSIAGIALLFRGEGIKGLVEIPTLLSNSLSYARIMAVGLASASLAVVVNEMSGELFHSGGVMAIFGVVVLLLGHTINLALGILGPFLHSLRLHYVEFFTKFFEGGGKPYRPFGAGTA
ncbi:V-type ATPase 116kDa subunit family protein [uncultured archaeon]|nr:V-type ATPase 116kDa subunit family protein [uncultured archaeon]